MTVVLLGNSRQFQGVSGDIKPTSGVPAGSVFDELDTGRRFFYDGSAWQVQPGSGGVLAAGEAHIGAVGANASKVSVTPTLTVHATYAAGDYVGTSAVPMTFAAVARVNAGTFVVSKVLLIDKGANVNAGELWLFDTAITPPADSAWWSISDADAAHVIDIIPIGTFYSSALNSVGIGGSTRLCKAATADSAIYGCYVIRAAPTADYADGDLTITIVTAQD